MSVARIFPALTALGVLLVTFTANVRFAGGNSKTGNDGSSHADRDCARSCRRGNQVGWCGFHAIAAGIGCVHAEAVIVRIGEAGDHSSGIRRQTVKVVLVRMLCRIIVTV